MRAILNLLGRSPFALLLKHMEQVTTCVTLLQEALDAYFSGDQEKVEALAKEIAEKEHAADQTKINIRNHLPTSLFLPVDRGNLLEILALQDSIADKAEDIGILLTLRPLSKVEGLQEVFLPFVKKTLETFNATKLVIEEMNELLESSFGGVEAEKVKRMVDDVAYLEDQTDLLEHKLLKILYNTEEELSCQAFSMWMRIVIELGAMSNIAEKLAFRVRMTLDLK
jgi:predicted phosphate transport protein (TIGR00153 family)